ncbi:MAG TPA: mannosyltransferase, partial [Chitinophagales bacterium]|nr:mannosyltransferase [Chitinophagales bacterium]
MSDSLHIISFNVPYPPDYGGVIDVYYKIKALHAAGVKIHLHTFIYGRKESIELESLCTSVKYYKRKPMWQGIFTNKPMIVDSRRSSALLQNLLKDNYPILFEGLHACYYLNDSKLSKRLKLVRMHNNEAEYYFSLAKRE